MRTPDTRVGTVTRIAAGFDRFAYRLRRQTPEVKLEGDTLINRFTNLAGATITHGYAEDGSLVSRKKSVLSPAESSIQLPRPSYTAPIDLFNGGKLEVVSYRARILAGERRGR